MGTLNAVNSYFLGDVVGYKTGVRVHVALSVRLIFLSKENVFTII